MDKDWSNTLWYWSWLPLWSSPYSPCLARISAIGSITSPGGSVRCSTTGAKVLPASIGRLILWGVTFVGIDNENNRRAIDADDLREIRVRRDSPSPGTRDAFLDLKNSLCDRILREMDPTIDLSQRSQVRPYVHDRLDPLLEERGIVLNRSEKRQLLEAIVADLIHSRT